MTTVISLSSIDSFQLLVLFTCQITVCEKAEDGCEGIAVRPRVRHTVVINRFQPPQCAQLSHDLPIKTEYKKQRPDSQANQVSSFFIVS